MRSSTHPDSKGRAGTCTWRSRLSHFGLESRPGSDSQLRLFYGRPKDIEISSPEIFRTVFKDSENCDGSLSVDLENTTIGGLETAAFRATVGTTCKPINLWKSANLPDPCESWKFVKSGKDKRLRIQNNEFYILRSKEKIRVPAGIAIYCRASDETIGEMRIHYAGFVHPHFGIRDDEDGTPLIFEVRGHQVDVNLRQGERMANLRLCTECQKDADPDAY